jgi:hypothetical protein
MTLLQIGNRIQTFTHCRSVISAKNGILSYTAARTSKFSLLFFGILGCLIHLWWFFVLRARTKSSLTPHLLNFFRYLFRIYLTNLSWYFCYTIDFIHSLIHSFIHSFTAQCLATSPQPLPKWVLHWTRSTASSFKFQYLLSSLRSSSKLLTSSTSSYPTLLFFLQ